jgi:hypothetical protein
MASQPIYQFYVELEDYKPRLWRRFQVPNNISMARLGYIIMTLFEMQARHLFSFEVPMTGNYHEDSDENFENEANGKIIDLFSGRPQSQYLRVELLDEDGFSDFEEDVLDAARTKVKNVLNRETEEMIFFYDYGDGWQVLLTLEKIYEDKELPGRELPRVLEGEGYGIIEDCGGTDCLVQIAKAYKKKKGSQYKEYCEWLGTEDLDLSAFDIDDMNFRLKKVPRIYSDIYEFRLEPTKQSIDLLTRKDKK